MERVIKALNEIGVGIQQNETSIGEVIKSIAKRFNELTEQQKKSVSEELANK